MTREVVITSYAEGIQHVEIAVTELNSATMNESGIPCSKESSDTFRLCVKKRFRERIENITCVLAGNNLKIPQGITQSLLFVDSGSRD